MISDEGTSASIKETLYKCEAGLKDPLDVIMSAIIQFESQLVTKKDSKKFKIYFWQHHSAKPLRD